MMLKIFSTVFLAAAAVPALAFTDAEVREMARKMGVDGFLKQLAAEMTSNTPIQINKETQIVSVFANRNNINLTYVIQNLSSAKEITNKGFISDTIDFQTKRLCTSAVSKILITEYGANYHYQYLGKSGENLFVFDVSKKSCR